MSTRVCLYECSEHGSWFAVVSESSDVDVVASDCCGHPDCRETVCFVHGHIDVGPTGEIVDDEINLPGNINTVTEDPGSFPSEFVVNTFECVGGAWAKTSMPTKAATLLVDIEMYAPMFVAFRDRHRDELAA